MKFEDLTPEQQEQVKNAKTPGDLAKLAKSVGKELTDEELEASAGGAKWSSNGNSGRPCPHCGKHVDYVSGQHMPKYCPHCGGQIVYSAND